MIGSTAILSLFVRSFLIFAVLAGCICSLVSARAISLFGQGTPASLAAAVRLVPVNAEYWSALGTVEASSSELFWNRALSLNRFDAQLWIQLGLYLESSKHQLGEAERMYLQATRVNRMYVPWWNLTNFYFRYRNKDRFLQTARTTLAVSPFNNSSLFFQAWSVAGDNQQVMNLLPRRSDVAFNYLNYLLEADRTDALEAAASNALSLPRRIPSDLLELVPNWLNLIGIAEDRLLAAGQPNAALRIWAKTYQNGWAKLPVPLPSSPLTNSSFQRTFSNHGFDWSFIPAEGITLDQLTGSRRVRFSLSGTQPEWWRLLQQFVPLAPGQTYQLRWKTDSSDFEHAIGLTWKVYPVRSGKVDIQSALASPDVIGEPDGNQPWKFSLPADANFALVALEFRRPVGQARAEGTLSIHDVEMIPAADSAP